jgi:hypothetical protein
VPAGKAVTATVSGVTSGRLFVRIDIDGQVISSATDIQIISQTEGQVAFIPGLPGNLGAGTHTSTIKVSMCTTDPACAGAQLAGSPKTINVIYQVGPIPPADTVAPYIGTSNVADEVIIRGKGFLSATTIKFGATPGTILSIPGDSEIRARYPALSAGNYPVTLNGGAIPFAASLRIVAPPAFPSAALGYPVAPESIRGLVYDSERKALLVGIGGYTDPSTNEVLRYEFSGGTWSAHPSTLTLPNLRDIALTMDGSHLLALSDGAISRLNPVTLVPVSTTPKPIPTPDPYDTLIAMTVANDGNVLITTDHYGGSGASTLFSYSLAQSSFWIPLNSGLTFGSLPYHGKAGASANGSTVAVLATDLSAAEPVFRYDTTTGLLNQTNLQLQARSPGEVIKFNRNGSRMAVRAYGDASHFDFVKVYDPTTYTLLGVLQLPSTTAGFALSPDGTRVYTMEMDATCRVRAFDLVTTPGGSNPLTEITSGYPISPVPCPSNGTPPFVDVRIVVSPAGDTLFAAGNFQAVVVHLP